MRRGTYRRLISMALAAAFLVVAGYGLGETVVPETETTVAGDESATEDRGLTRKTG